MNKNYKNSSFKGYDFIMTKFQIICTYLLKIIYKTIILFVYQKALLGTFHTSFLTTQ